MRAAHERANNARKPHKQRYENINDDGYVTITLTDDFINAGVSVVTIENCDFLDVTGAINSSLNNALPEYEKRWALASYIWFKNRVGSGKEWDIKLLNPWNDTIGSGTYPGAYNKTVIFNGFYATPEILGNITYGCLGTAVGYNESTLLTGGDYAAGGIKGIFTGADSQEDKKWIKYGIGYYNNFKK